MNAAISGAKGFALVIDGETVDVIDRDGWRRPARAEHARRMLDEPGDTSFVECKDLPEVLRRLQAAIDAADALHSTLILLDSQLSKDTKLAACSELEELFQIESIVESVERVLYSRSLGEEHDLAGARALAPMPTVSKFLSGLEFVQSAIARVLCAWERAPENLFAYGVEGIPYVLKASRQEIFMRFARAGIVRDFVRMASWGSVREYQALLRISSFPDNQHLKQLIVWLGRDLLDLPLYESRSEPPSMAAEEIVPYGRAYKIPDTPGDRRQDQEGNQTDSRVRRPGRPKPS